MAKRQLEVELSDGTKVTVGPICWDAWKNVKEALTDLLAGPIAFQIGEILTGPLVGQLQAVLAARDPEGESEPLWTNEQTLALLPAAGDQLKTAVPDLIRNAFEFLDRLSPELAIGCVAEWRDSRGQPTIDVDLLHAADVLAVRDAAFEMNDFQKLLESEKNFIAAMVNRVIGLIGSSKT